MRPRSAFGELVLQSFHARTKHLGAQRQARILEVARDLHRRRQARGDPPPAKREP